MTPLTHERYTEICKEFGLTYHEGFGGPYWCDEYDEETEWHEKGADSCAYVYTEYDFRIDDGLNWLATSKEVCYTEETLIACLKKCAKGLQVFKKEIIKRKIQKIYKEDEDDF